MVVCGLSVGIAGVRRWGKMRDLICTDRTKMLSLKFNSSSKFWWRCHLDGKDTGHFVHT